MAHAHASAAVLALAVSACTAIRAPDVLPVDRASLPERRPVVGVVEPLPHLDPDQPLSEWSELWVRESEAELHSAAHLIALLRASGLFGEVNFVCQLESSPDLAVAVSASPRPSDPEESSRVMFVYWLLTIGLVPWVETRDYGTQFTFIDAAAQSVALEHLETSVVGWAALPMNISSRWQSQRDPDRRAESLTRALMQADPDPLLPENWLTPHNAGRLTSRCSGRGNAVPISTMVD